MTDAFAATAALAACDGAACAAAREEALGLFHETYAAGDALGLCKWLAMQAGADTADSLARAERLRHHPGYAMTNPSKLRALVGAFASNLRRLHAGNGEGYRWLADRVLEVCPRPSTRRMRGGIASWLP